MLLLLVVVVAALAVVPSAAAHQTLVNNNVAVTLHVAPNDEPIAAQEAIVSIPRIATSKGKFAWATCACTMRIFQPAGAVLLDGPAVPRRTFTFPSAGAYGITVAGRVKRNGKWARFKVTFGIRAA
jgi:hypothetical protein